MQFLLTTLVRKHWPVIILLAFFAFIFFNLLSSHMLEPHGDGLYSGGSTWGDLALHLTIANNFAERGFFTQTPIFYGEKISYPVFMDFVTGALVRRGMNMRWALIVPSFTFSMISVYLIYLLALHVSKSRFAAFFAPIFFFFNGSMAALQYFWNDYKESGLDMLQFLGSMNYSYAHLADYNIRFSNIISDYILPQRTFIPGLALGTLALIFLWKYWEKHDTKQLLYAGIAVSFLPFIHAHTFVAIIVSAFFLFLIQLHYGKNDAGLIMRNWLYFAVPVVFIGLPQFAVIFPWGKESFTRFYFGWMKGTDSFSAFWIKNLSPHIFIFSAALISVEAKFRKFAYAFLWLFLLTNLFIFQPHDYDNMKLMLWPFLVLCIAAAWFMDILFKKFKIWSLALIAPIIIGMTLTGALSVYRESYVSWRMFSKEDLALADFVKTNTPPDSLFLTSDRHNHPIPTLAGRQIMMGFRGWLWTHGIRDAQRAVDVNDIYNGTPGAFDLINKYGIDYAVIEDTQKVNNIFFGQHFPLIFENIYFSVYKL